MSKKVISVPKTKRIGSVWEQPLRVAAYCRVSTDSKEQQCSLKNQIVFYSNYIRRQTNWTLVNVYSDTASGIRTKKRFGYQQLLKDCSKEKIDLIIVKSLSLFGRDTKETIEQIRRLKRMIIGVYVETGGLNTLEINDSLIDWYAALAQAESQSISENTKFGIHQRMRTGKTILNHTQFLGYTKGPDGVLQIVPKEAEVVRKIFDLYIQGNGVRKIKRYLEEHGIKTVTGKTEWSTSTIDRMLSNEKYVGEVLMQKTYTLDFLTGKQVRNCGQLAMYLVENVHEPIIDRTTFDTVQKIIGNVGVNIQRGAAGGVADDGGEGFDVHSVFQRGCRECMAQIVEAYFLASNPFQDCSQPLSDGVRVPGRIIIERGGKHPLGSCSSLVFFENIQHRRGKDMKR